MASDIPPNAESTWSYPIRSCRLCREDVDPTVTVTNPGLPASFRSTSVTYISEDCGRLIKPCKCKGTQRYIHEACLAELRAKSPVKNAYLKCDLCGFQYNTKRLLVHDILLSRVARMLLTVLIVIFLMFMLGFIADPIINLYVDPVETMATARFWTPVTVDNISEEANESWWIQHFAKGLISMGVVGFVKAVLLANPFQFWNLRHSGLLGGGARAGNTGRDRAVNISWIAVMIGVGSALYFFYQQVAKFSHSTLSKFANNIIEVQMDDDDDDLRPPPGTTPSAPKANFSPESTNQPCATDASNEPEDSKIETGMPKVSGEYKVTLDDESSPSEAQPTATFSSPVGQLSQMSASTLETDRDPVAYSSAIQEAQAHGWSFKDVEDDLIEIHANDPAP